MYEKEAERIYKIITTNNGPVDYPEYQDVTLMDEKNTFGGTVYLTGRPDLIEEHCGEGVPCAVIVNNCAASLGALAALDKAQAIEVIKECLETRRGTTAYRSCLNLLENY